VGLALALARWAVVARADGLVFTRVAAVPARTYAIVLGAAVHPDGWPSDALLDRLESARRLFAAGKVRLIYVSGDHASRDEDGVMARWLVAHGVPAAVVIRDGVGVRTRATMEDAWAAGIRDAVVCTQRFHMARSVAWARHVGIDAVGLESEELEYAERRKDRLRELVASAVALVELWVD
jgi:vancomycin permeability regulator SanA